jgi:hypothetical protein
VICASELVLGGEFRRCLRTFSANRGINTLNHVGLTKLSFETITYFGPSVPGAYLYLLVCGYLVLDSIFNHSHASSRPY